MDEPTVITNDITTDSAGVEFAMLEVLFPDGWVMGKQYLWLSANHFDQHNRLGLQLVRVAQSLKESNG